MISHGEGFVLRHRSGRYFNHVAHFETLKRIDGTDSGCHDPDVPMQIVYRLVETPFHADLIYIRECWGRFLDGLDWRAVADQFEVIPGPGCICCGERWGMMHTAVDGSHRCDKHRDRNPCAIEGCKRTTAADGRYGSDQWLCAEHWRRFVPPHSPLRRAYHRFFRLAKRNGWDRSLERRYWRFWRGLVAQARRKAEGGSIDEAEINKLFGWEDAA